MIPKIIHYCWFGGKPLPSEAKEYMESWKKYCPDFELMRWDENNFDVNSCQFVKEAYENKKYAFVTDYVRLYALVKYGGIYMDTDVEVIKPLYEFLSLRAFTGFETPDGALTGIMGSEKGFPLYDELVKDYDNRPFVNRNGTFNQTTNIVYFTDKCIKYGLKPNGKEQTVQGLTLFPAEYFCPMSPGTRELIITENTHTIHHFAASWLAEDSKKLQRIRNKCLKKYGEKYGQHIYHLLAIPTKIHMIFFKEKTEQ